MGGRHVAIFAAATIVLVGCARDHGRDSSAPSAQRDVEPPAVLPAPAVDASESNDARATRVPNGCEYAGRHYMLGERFENREECLSCRCMRYGETHCDNGLCVDFVTACDGGPCTSCRIGLQTLPVLTGLTCSDGCNECTCVPHGDWLMTLQACGDLPLLEQCDASTARTGDSRLVFFDPTQRGRIELRTTFSSRRLRHDDSRARVLRVR